MCETKWNLMPPHQSCKPRGSPAQGKSLLVSLRERSIYSLREGSGGDSSSDLTFLLSTGGTGSKHANEFLPGFLGPSACSGGSQVTEAMPQASEAAEYE